MFRTLKHWLVTIMAPLLLAACKPAEVAPVLPAPRVETPRWPRAEPEASGPKEWSGYPPEVQAEFERARAVLGEELDGWTLGSLAPALLDWVPPGESRNVWLSVDGAPCELVILEHPAEQAEAEVDMSLYARFRVRETTTENGERQRSFEAGSIGHFVDFGNGGGDELWDGERWVEIGGYGVGEPPESSRILSSVRGGVARFDAPWERPFVECDSPQFRSCESGGHRLCPSCDKLRVGVVGDRTYGPRRVGPTCSDPCPPSGPEHPELPFIRELLERYGAFGAPTRGPVTLMFRDEAQCRAEVPI